MAARARQDAALAAILNLPEHEGASGGSIRVREIQEAINKLKYGKASGVDCISTDLLKVCAGNRPMLVGLRAEIEDEVPFGLPRPSEFEQPNAACS